MIVWCLQNFQNGQLAIEVYGPGDRIDVYVETTHQKFLEIIG